MPVWISRINANSTILKSVCGGTSRFICPTSVSPVHWYRMASWFFNDPRLLSEKEIGGRWDHLLISNMLDSLFAVAGRMDDFSKWSNDFYFLIFIKIPAKGVMLDNSLIFCRNSRSPVHEAGFAGGDIWIFNADLFFHVPEVCEQWISKRLEDFFSLCMAQCETNLFSFQIKINFKLLLCIHASMFGKSAVKQWFVKNFWCGNIFVI